MLAWALLYLLSFLHKINITSFKGAKMNCKQVNYAYPTSDLACRYGFPHNGCWTIEIGEGSFTPWSKEIVSVWPTERQAIDWAHRIDLPWSQCWINCQQPVLV